MNGDYDLKRRVNLDHLILMNTININFNGELSKINSKLSIKMHNVCFLLKQDIGCKHGLQYSPSNVQLLEHRYFQTL